MEAEIAKLIGINLEFGSAPDGDQRVPYVVLRLQSSMAGSTVNLAPLWMTADHARALAQQLQLAANSAGKPPGDTPVH